tara:strand:- start:37 stop:210 length:174 start_codon:yes stop_codon:yes gene_type:complete
MRDIKLVPGDILVVPDGWTITIRGRQVEISHKNYTGESRTGFAWGELMKQMAEQELT